MYCYLPRSTYIFYKALTSGEADPGSGLALLIVVGALQRQEVLAARRVARGVQPAADERPQLALLALVRAVRVGRVHVGGHLVHLLTVSCVSNREPVSEDLWWLQTGINSK